MYRSLRSSEHTFHFNKPVTAAAIEMFDPELCLVWNQRWSTFQLMRRRRVARRYWIEGIGHVTYIDEILAHQMDWSMGLVDGHDNPTPLVIACVLGDLFKMNDKEDVRPGDTRRYRDSEERLVDKIRDHRQKVAETVRDNYRHAFAANRRQLLPALERLHNHPTFVR